MQIAERILALRKADGDVAVPVRLFAPVAREKDWACRFTIGWPDGAFEMGVFGVDSAQSLELALRTIGASIYTSDHHASGELMWLEPGKGYGFPVPNSLRDLLVGDDKTFL
jgi:hypothetical protein